MALTPEAVVRALYEAFNGGGRDLPAKLLDPEIEYVNPEQALEPGTRTGTAEWRKAMGRVREVFGSASHIEVREIEAAGELVLAVVDFHLRADHADLETALPQGHLWTIEDGRATRFRWWPDPARAREEFERATRGPA